MILLWLKIFRNKRSIQNLKIMGLILFLGRPKVKTSKKMNELDQLNIYKNNYEEEKSEIYDEKVSDIDLDKYFSGKTSSRKQLKQPEKYKLVGDNENNLPIINNHQKNEGKSINKIEKLKMLEEDVLDTDELNLQTNKVKKDALKPKNKLKPAVEIIINKNRITNKNFELLTDYVILYQLEVRGKPDEFRKTFLDRALDQIDELKMRSGFVKYYNSIFVTRIVLVIICIITFNTKRVQQVLFVFGSQVLFTACSLWYQCKLGFLKTNCFYVFNHFFQEIALSFFLFGAVFLSFNGDHHFSEEKLYYLEVMMTISLALSMLIEMLSLLGAIFTFVANIWSMLRNCCKKKKKKTGEKEILEEKHEKNEFDLSDDKL